MPPWPVNHFGACKMNILLVGSYLSPDLVGGAEQSAANLRAVLERAGHQFATLRWGQAQAFTFTSNITSNAHNGSNGADFTVQTWRPSEPIAVISGLTKAEFYLMEFLTTADAQQVQDFTRRQHIDLIIINSFRGIGYRFIEKLGQAGIPVICVLHDFALICLNKGKARKGKICQKPCSACRIVTGLNRKALRQVDRLALVAPSQFVLDHVANGLQLDHAICHHIPNPNRYRLVPRIRDHHYPLVLGFIGRLDIDKGIAGLLAHADRLHQQTGLKLMIAGAGHLAQSVADFAAQRPWVDFRGQVPGDRVHEVYDSIDILTTPSLWPENLPGSLVQALGCGIPAVGFDIGGIPEVIDHGRTGLVAPFGDFAALCDRIVELHHDRNLLARLSRNALRAADRYDPDMLGQRWIDLVNTIAGTQTITPPIKTCAQSACR